MTTSYQRRTAMAATTLSTLLLLLTGPGDARAQLATDPSSPPQSPPADEAEVQAEPPPPEATEVVPPVPAETPVESVESEEAEEAEAAAPMPVEPSEPPDPLIEAEWGRGVTLRSDDGNFSLQIRGRIQALAQVETAGPADSDPNIELMVRRARLVFLGNLLSSDLQYYVQLGLAPRDMEADLLIPLRDAVLTWSGVRDMNVRVGQMKVPFNRERVISSSALELVDRSIVNAELTLDRDIGIQLFSNDLFGLGGYLGYQLGVFGGEGRLRFNEGVGLLYVARVQVQPTGRFDDAYTMVDFTREERLRISLGAGVAFNHQSGRERSTTGNFYQLEGFDELHAEGDLMLKYGGFSLMAEFLYRQAQGVSERTGMVDGEMITERARNGVGWYVQAGYLFEYPIEVVARYADIQPIGDVTALTQRRELTLGLNWFPMRHDLKLQFDWSHLSGERFEDGTHRFRLQMQAYF